MTRALFVTCILILCTGLHTQAAELNFEKPINFDEVVKGKVFRGGQPSSIQLRDLKEKLGIKTVIKLDLKEEEVSNKNDPFDEVSFVKNELGIEIVDASTPPSTLANAVRDPDYNKIRKALETLEDETKWPIYVHCKHGQDRTGLVIGLFRVMNTREDVHKNLEEAYQEMKDHNFHSELLGLSEYWRKFKKTKGKELPEPEMRNAFK